MLTVFSRKTIPVFEQPHGKETCFLTLIPNPQHSFVPLPHILLLVAWEKSPVPPFSIPSLQEVVESNEVASQLSFL